MASRRFQNTSTITKTTTNKPAPKITTISVPIKQTRTPTTVGALAVRASKFTSRATAPPVTRTFVKPVTISPPVSNLTGGRIAQNQGGDLVYDNRLLFGTTKSGVPTRQVLPASNPTIFSGLFGQPTVNTYNASPQIVPIQNPSVAYDQNPPPQLHVNNNQVVNPNTKTNSNFGGLGANPWNPLEAIAGLFGMAPQQDPASQWLPQIEDNTQSTGYPPYTAMAPPIDQKIGNGFNFNKTITDPSQTIKNLFQNKYILYAGLAVGALVVLKIVMGFGGGKGGGGGTKIYT